MSENAHKYSFGIVRGSSNDRIDFALCAREGEDFCGYATVIELDSESAYMQHGGNLEPSRGNVKTFRAYTMIIDHLKSNYKNVSTRIFNKNTAMIKLAFKVGFLVTGTDTSKNGQVYLTLDLN